MPLAHVFANMLAPPAILAERRVSVLLISRIALQGLERLYQQIWMEEVLAVHWRRVEA